MKKSLSFLLSFLILVSTFLFNTQKTEALEMNEEARERKSYERSLSVFEYVYEKNPFFEEEFFDFVMVQEAVYEKPNLVITDLTTVHEDIQDYKLVPFTVYIENTGGMTREDIYLTWKIDGKTVGTTVLERGMFPYERRSSTFEWRAVPGNHILTVVVDERDYIEEEDEGDNIFEKELYVRDALKLNLNRYSVDRPFVQTLDTGSGFSVAIRKDGKIAFTGNGREGRSNVSLWEDIVQLSAGATHIVGLKADGTAVVAGYNADNLYNVGGWEDIVQVSAGYDHTVGLKRDGTVIAVGLNNYNQCSLEDWEDIVQISAGESFTVGLKADGSVVAKGINNQGQCNLGDWEDIVQVSAGMNHTVGLKSDGTAIAVGNNQYGQCDVERWSELVHVWAGDKVTIGVRKDGSVLACGNNDYGQTNVSHWTDIVQAFAGNNFTLALRQDGKVLATGDNRKGQCNFAGVEWPDAEDIIQVSAGTNHTVLLRSNGKVIAIGANNYGQCDLSEWEDIIQVAAGEDHTVGLRRDGKVVAVGRNLKGECDVEDLEDIVQISASFSSTAALRSDGKVFVLGYGASNRINNWEDIIQVSSGYLRTVGLQRNGRPVAEGYNYYGQNNIENWEDIIQVSAGENHTLGLRQDGKVLAAGRNYNGECRVSDWEDIIQVAAGENYSLGLRADGRVEQAGSNFDLSEWENIVQISAGDYHAIALKRDGTVIGAGDNTYGQSKEIAAEILSVPELFREEAFSLEVTELSYSFDESYNEEDYCDGMNMTIHAEIMNKSSQLIDSTAVLFKLDDHVVGSKTINQFQPGEKRTVSLSCLFDAGAKNLIVIPDSRFPDNAVTTLSLPDVEKAELSLSVRIENYNNRFIVYASVSNEGNTTIRNIDIDYVLDGEKIGSSTIRNGIKKGETRISSLQFYTTAGTHQLKVLVDPQNIVPEENKENNDYTEEITAVIIPGVEFLNLERGQKITSPYQIEWQAASQHYNPDELKISLSLINDKGEFLIAKDIENSGFYNWSFPDIPEGEYNLRIIATDPKGNASEASRLIRIINPARIEITHNSYKMIILEGDEAKLDLLVKNLQPQEDRIILSIEKDKSLVMDDDIILTMEPWEERWIQLDISYPSCGLYQINIVAESENIPSIRCEETVELAVLPPVLQSFFEHLRRFFAEMNLL